MSDSGPRDAQIARSVGGEGLMPFERFAAQGRKLTGPGSIYLPLYWLKPKSMRFWMWEGVGGNVGQSSCVGFCTDAGWLEPGRSLSRSQRFGNSFGRFPLPWNNGCSVCDLNNVVPVAFETVETSPSVSDVGRTRSD